MKDPSETSTAAHEFSRRCQRATPVECTRSRNCGLRDKDQSYAYRETSVPREGTHIVVGRGSRFMFKTHESSERAAYNILGENVIASSARDRYSRMPVSAVARSLVRWPSVLILGAVAACLIVASVAWLVPLALNR